MNQFPICHIYLYTLRKIKIASLIMGEVSTSPQERQNSSRNLSKVVYEEIGNLELESGTILPSVIIAYESYGKLNAQADNVILICHAFSGDSHAAFYYEGDEKPGWWDDYIGPGKAIDTEKFFVICSNVVGGCRGSTGPLSVNPLTGQIYGALFPFVTVYDMVKAQNCLLERLGISTLHAVIGGSMGGMQALQWTVSYPEKVEHAVLLASSAEHSAQQIAFNEVGRQAILSDPKYNGGNYGKDIPKSGLSLARMIGHITYLSEELMKEKFGRQGPRKGWHTADFAVGSYLVYQGEKFVDRFDPNTYILLSKALDHFSLGKGVTLTHNLSGVKSKFLVVAFNSDWLYPPEQSEEIVKSLEILNIPVSYCVLNTKEGHDSFLLPNNQLERIIARFLENDDS